MPSPQPSLPSSPTDTGLAKPLGQPQAEGVRALLEREREEILAKCTQCGRCFEVCPMVGYESNLRQQPAGTVVAGVLEVLRSRPGTPDSLRWIEICTKSGLCDQHCPEGISPKMMLRLGRIVALGATGQPAQIASKEDPDYFNKVHAFGRLSLSEDERKAWTVAPPRRERGAV